MSLTDITLDENEINDQPQEIDTRSPELVLKDDVDTIVLKMEEAEVKTEDQFISAQEWLKQNKTIQKQVKEHFEAERKRTYEAYTAVTGKIKEMTDLLKKGETIVKKKLGAYQLEQERIQREAERKAREEEAKRLREAEEKAKAEAKEKGIPEEEAVKQMELSVSPVPVPVKKEAPKVKGVSFAVKWRYEVKDFSQVPDEYKILDESKVNKIVSAMKGDTKIPGIAVYEDKVVRA